MTAVELRGAGVLSAVPHGRQYMSCWGEQHMRAVELTGAGVHSHEKKIKTRL